MKINLERCRRGMEEIRIEGWPGNKDANPKRHKAIEDAITEIQTKGEKALKEQYLGVKNYAAFGDQREDHQYGYGPAHGYIVFRIERKNRDKPIANKEDVIYLLECVRDTGSCSFPDSKKHGKQTSGNLTDCIKEYDHLVKWTGFFEDWFNALEVDAHV